MKNLIDEYDLLFLNEKKTSAKISCTGFEVYQHSVKQGHQGSVALLLKPKFAKFVKRIDKSYENVLVCELALIQNTVFVGCFIPPSDSPYYDDAYGHLQSLVRNDKEKTFFIIGDLNSRVSTPSMHGDDNLSYVNFEDSGIVKRNGRGTMQMWKDCNLIVINNLQYGEKYFKSRLSFRKKAQFRALVPV